MLEKNKDQEINEINIYESLENFINDSKELYDELTPLCNENIGDDNKNILFKYLTHIQFGLYILPYLPLKDILILRQTSKEINLIINSDICCLNYYFKILKKSNSLNNKDIKSKIPNKSSNQLKPLEDINEESEFLEQKKILNKIKAYIKSPEFVLKNLIKIYKVELDYLKYEEKHQIRYMKSLVEIKNKLSNEYQMIQKKEIKQNKIISNKEEKEEINNIEIIDLKKKIEELKLKKENLLFKLNKEKKINEDLIKKNNDKTKIINKFKNICFNENDDMEEIEIDDLNEINSLFKNF
jgi:hypothetical protein